MTRLIDADKLKDEVLKQGTTYICLLIDNAPTVKTTFPNCDSGYAQGYSDGYLKGKEERPQGKWIYHEEWETEGGCGYECSCCGRTYDYDMNFCGYCGADMRGGEE